MGGVFPSHVREKMIITYRNPSECSVSIPDGRRINPCLSYEAVYYKQGPYHKERKVYQANALFSHKAYPHDVFFHTGLLRRIMNYCKEQNISVEIAGKPKILLTRDPNLNGITFKEDQLRLIKKGLLHQRGQLISPTGTGKTIIGLAVLSSLPRNNRYLWTCHTKDLMYQTWEEARKFFPSVGRAGDGYKETDKQIIVGINKTLRGLMDNGMLPEVHGVIVDESHNISKLDNDYANLIFRMPCYFRIGLTASPTTPEKDGEPGFASEGLLGPILGEFTIKEATEKGILAKVSVRMIKIPIDYDIKYIQKYKDAYEEGIVKRLDKLQAIAEVAAKHVNAGDSVLIMVTRRDHGENLGNVLASMGVPCTYVHGDASGIFRNETKEKLNSKEIKCVIATVVWKEGINIPELNVIIYAGEGKGDRAVIQSIGRGTRITETKKVLIYYDIFDPSNSYFMEHFGLRFMLYCDLGWVT